MPAGVALFPEPEFAERVERLRGELAVALGVEREPTPPHVSLRVATGYDTAVSEALVDVSASTDPFSLTTSGLGVFTATGVVYLPVARSTPLVELYERVASVVAPHVTAPNDYYTDERWIPHVTLAQGLDGETAATAVELLGDRDHAHTFEVEALGLLDHPIRDPVTVERFPL
jgi:2'-5' RNA ligase